MDQANILSLLNEVVSPEHMEVLERENELNIGIGAPGIGRLFLGEEEVASGPLEKTVPLMLNFSGSLTCGYHHAEPFFGYELPFHFDGTIRRVDVRTHSNAVIDDALALELYLKSQ